MLPKKLPPVPPDEFEGEPGEKPVPRKMKCPLFRRRRSSIRMVHEPELWEMVTISRE